MNKHKTEELENKIFYSIFSIARNDLADKKEEGRFFTILVKSIFSRLFKDWFFVDSPREIFIDFSRLNK